MKSNIYSEHTLFQLITNASELLQYMNHALFLSFRWFCACHWFSCFSLVRRWSPHRTTFRDGPNGLSALISLTNVNTGNKQLTHDDIKVYTNYVAATYLKIILHSWELTGQYRSWTPNLKRLTVFCLRLAYHADHWLATGTWLPSWKICCEIQTKSNEM